VARKTKEYSRGFIYLTCRSAVVAMKRTKDDIVRVYFGLNV
jgi:hypothetical protein